MQTLIALGSGGIQGLGLGESRQKHYYVPNAHTDTIFAIIGEELGLIGTLLVVLLFGILAWRGLVIASRSSDMFGRLLAVGMIGKVIWQAILNIAVITNTVPYTGVPLPLISYGASSLVVTMISIGVLYSVLRFRAESPQPSSSFDGAPSGAPRDSAPVRACASTEHGSTMPDDADRKGRAAGGRCSLHWNRRDGYAGAC